MKTVVLITCTKSKFVGIHKAEKLYAKSNNFVKYIACAKLLADYQDIFVISALHKLVPLYREIEWYDCTLKGKSEQEINAWGKSVAEQLTKLYDIDKTKVIVLADNDYCSALKPYLPCMDTPLEGFGCDPKGYNQLDAYVISFIENSTQNDNEIMERMKTPC